MVPNFSNASLLGKALRLPLRMIPEETVVRVVSGPARGAKWIIGSATHGAWLGTYERDKCELFARTIRNGSTVFDIGAHVGIYTVLAARLVGSAGRVVAFEPVPRNLGFLREHIRLNNLCNVTVIDSAVADRSGMAHFAEARASQMGTLSDDGALEVNVVSIDEMVMAGNLPPPQYVKIDIEGGETFALRGMRAVLEKHKPTLFLATHADEINDLCFPFLKQVGYSVVPIDGVPLTNTREVISVPR